MSPALLLMLAACSAKLPSALQPDAPTEARPTPIEVHDLDSAAQALVGTDPLLRRPRVTADWQAIDGGAPIADWANLAARSALQASDWFALERRWPGTIAVPLARGARLADLESTVAGDLREDQQLALVALLAPLSGVNQASPSDIRPPLEWLESRAGGLSRAEAVLHLAERGVLLGWLDGPDIPLQAPAAAIKPGIHDRLATSPAGALLLARAAGATDPAASQTGQAELEQATTLALLSAAADRDSEQAALKQRFASEAQSLRDQGLDLPDQHDIALRTLLRRSQDSLLADAASTRSTGLALVAISAERWSGSCPDRPCVGLDRTLGLQRAGTWHPDAARLAAAWRVVAAKEALDTLEVTLDQPTYGAGAVDLVDLLFGTGAEAVDLSLLRQRTPGPSTWLALTRAAGAADATDAESGIAALRKLLVQLADEALATRPPAEQREAIERIRARASG